MDVPALYRRAAGRFEELVESIKEDQWADPTPCTEWDVRALVNHLVYESLWAVPLLEGKTIADVGDVYEKDDFLGVDPKKTAREALAAAKTAV